ncbi:TPA: hypothetical protein U1255_001798, partial [Streptococcus suis]|nr:hypothetical protein [Streptococcus suis]
ASNPFQSNWNELNNKLVNIRKYFSELEELDVENINSYLYSYLSSNRQNDSQGRMIYILYVDSPIDKDLEIRKIKNFISFYVEQSNQNIEIAVKNFIYLCKENSYIGNYFSNSSPSYFFPALYLLRKKFSNIRENVTDFENNVVRPIQAKLDEIETASSEKYSEITKLTENKSNETRKYFEEKVDELDRFQKKLNDWQDSKEELLDNLEETYKNKLSLEAPETLWIERAEEYRELASRWTKALIISAILLIGTLSLLVITLHNYSQGIIKEIPFISESFILVSAVSFFIYIVRIIIKIVMSNHHIAAEYRQKAALTRFYQALTYSGDSIDKEERLIIINALFGRVETGLVKTDTSNDSDAIIALLSKSIK